MTHIITSLAIVSHDSIPIYDDLWPTLGLLDVLTSERSRKPCGAVVGLSSSCLGVRFTLQIDQLPGWFLTGSFRVLVHRLKVEAGAQVSWKKRK